MFSTCASLLAKETRKPKTFVIKADVAFPCVYTNLCTLPCIYIYIMYIHMSACMHIFIYRDIDVEIETDIDVLFSVKARNHAHIMYACSHVATYA